MAAPADHNQDGPSRDTFLKYVAIAIHDNQQLEAAKAIRSANRKLAKKIGEIDLGDMDMAIKVSDWAPSDIAKYFSRKFSYLNHLGVSPGTQFDLFGGVTPQVKEAPDFYSAGLYAGMRGDPEAKPPQNLSGPEQQRYTEGFQNGAKFHAEGLELRARNMAASQGQAGKADPKAKATGPTAEEAQVDLEQAIAEGKVLDLALESFDCNSLAECTPANFLGDQDAYERAIVVRVTDGEQTLVLKDRGGHTEPPFETTPAPAAEAKPAPKPRGRKKADLTVVH